MIHLSSRFAGLVSRRGLQTSSAGFSANAKSNLAKLRKKTGYSLSLCKKALETSEQDVTKAELWLKEQALSQGWEKANKLEGRNTTQGLIGLLVRENAAAMVELNCETDFVARNNQFHELLNEISSVALKHAPEIDDSSPAGVAVQHIRREDLSAMTNPGGRTLADLIALNIGQIGENIVLRRGVVVRVKSKGLLALGGVTHPSGNIHHVKDVQYGRYGAVMAFAKDPKIGVIPDGQTTATMARQLCQHIIGLNPIRIGDMATFKSISSSPNRGEEEVQAAAPKQEQQQQQGESSTEGGAEAEGEGSDGGLMRRPVDHEELIHQEFLLDPSLKVGNVLLETGIAVKDFVRFEVGQEF